MVILRGCMADARHPKTYKEGKSQVTVPWKRRVIAKLEENDKNEAAPANIEQLRKMVKAPKAGLNKLFDLKRDPPQLTSGFVDDITKVLGVLPPVLEDDKDDPDFARDVLLLRSLDVQVRRALMLTAASLPKKRGRG